MNHALGLELPLELVRGLEPDRPALAELHELLGLDVAHLARRERLDAERAKARVREPARLVQRVLHLVEHLVNNVRDGLARQLPLKRLVDALHNPRLGHSARQNEKEKKEKKI
jgi:hypothetical protein